MSTKTRLDDLLLEWETAQECGCPVSPEELCADWPEGLQELRRRARLLEALAPALDLEAGTEADGGRGPPDRGDWPELPNYEVLGVLGRGGMGMVYRARQKTLGREVALKVLRPGARTGHGAAQRLEREARVLAQLRHDHIVDVYEAGLYEGRPYVVMELVRGGSLDKQLGRFQGNQADAAALVERVAGAVHHAHEQGLLHRDLKPANIFLDESGKPKVGDFGLAKLFEADRPAPPLPQDNTLSLEAGGGPGPLTSAGANPGTPLYMAPEQFRAGAGSVTRRTDVWALGVILYELLTGRRPFPSAGREGIVSRVCKQEPTPPRALRPGISPALEAVCLKCLRKDPAQRYPSAAAVADELKRWRRGEWPEAYRAGRHRRIWRYVRRHPVAATAVVLVATFVGFLALFGWRPPGWDEWRYRRAVSKFEKELAAGRPACVITPDTRDLAHRWRAGHGWVRYQNKDPEAGSVSLTALEPSLVEVLPDPQTTSYRVIAEMRQDVSYNAFGKIGLYVAHTQHAAAEEPQHFYAMASFADLSQLYKDKKGQRGSQFNLELCYSGPAPSSPLGSDKFGGDGIFYIPKDPAQGPGEWRTLELRVSPGKLLSYWEGRALSCSPAKDLETWTPGLHRRHPELRDVQVSMPERGAIGIYLYGSSLSIRRLTVEPLDHTHLLKGAGHAELGNH